MTQTVALIVHALLDAPENWSVSGSVVSNGYYKIYLNATCYGMSNSSYQSSPEEMAMLKSALNQWKEETGWAPPADNDSAPVMKTKNTQIGNTDAQILSAYKEFSRSVRSNIKSFTLHKDGGIFCHGVQKSVDALDYVISTAHHSGAKAE